MKIEDWHERKMVTDAEYAEAVARLGDAMGRLGVGAESASRAIRGAAFAIRTLATRFHPPPHYNPTPHFGLRPEGPC